MSRELGDSLEAVGRRLASMSQLEFALSDATWGGTRGRGVRPVSMEPGTGFVIAMSRSLHSVEALLVTDAFAGDLVRTIGEAITFGPSVWSDLEREAVEAGISIGVTVNDEYQPDFAEMPQDPWRTLEIECQKRVRRQSGEVEESLFEVARMCLSLVLSGLDVIVEDDGDQRLPEGARTQVSVNRYERDPVNRMRCIEFYGSTCWVCDFDFEVSYGDLGSGYIVVHHIIPVSQMGAGYLVDPVTDLVPLCPNCHAMVHREDPPIGPADLRSQLGKPSKAFGHVQVT